MKATLFVLLVSTLLGADVTTFDDRLAGIASARTDADRQAAVDLILNESQKIVTAAFTPSQSKLVTEYRRLRNDTQTGASSGSAGSTSLVSNPYLADIFGVSLESGAILKTVSGTTTNLQIKPAGIFCAVSNGDGARAVAGTDCMEFWKRIGVVAAFDKNRSNAPAPLIALQDDLSQLRIHFDLLQRTVSRASKEVNDRMARQAGLATGIAMLFFTDPALLHWSKETRADLLQAANSTTDAERKQALAEIWSAALDKLGRLLQADPSLRAASPSLAAFANLNANTNLRALVADKLERTSLAIEYSWDRADVATADKGQRPPDLSTARLIYARNYQPLVLTANAEMSWFNKTLPGMQGAFRDWQVSAAATFLLNGIPYFGQPALSFAGLIGDLRQQPLGFNYVVPVVDLAGPIRAFNTRLEFPTANKSVTIPFSFTYTNRTDLNKQPDVRGSIGIALRFDSFFPAKL
jgi:hypothetical protein